MNKLALYNFLQSDYVQCYEKRGDMYLVWIYTYGVDEFDKLISTEFKDDGGIPMVLKDGCICVDLAAADIGLYAEELEGVFYE